MQAASGYSCSLQTNGKYVLARSLLPQPSSWKFLDQRNGFYQEVWKTVKIFFEFSNKCQKLSMGKWPCYSPTPLPPKLAELRRNPQGVTPSLLSLGNRTADANWVQRARLHCHPEFPTQTTFFKGGLHVTEEELLS